MELQENSWTCGWRYLQLSSQTVGELSVRLKELGTYTPIEFNRRPSNQSNQKLIDGKQQSFSTLCCVQGLCLGIAYQESSMITLFSVAVHLLFKSKSSTCHLDPVMTLWGWSIIDVHDPQASTRMYKCVQWCVWSLWGLTVLLAVSETQLQTFSYTKLWRAVSRWWLRSQPTCVMSLNTCVRALLQPLQSWCVYRTSDNPASMDRSQTVFSLGHRSSDVHTVWGNFVLTCFCSYKNSWWFYRNTMQTWEWTNDFY